MAKSKKKRIKVKKLKHNLKDKHVTNKIKGRGYDDPAEMVVTNTKKIKKQDNKKQQIKKVEVKKDNKKRKK